MSRRRRYTAVAGAAGFLLVALLMVAGSTLALDVAGLREVAAWRSPVLTRVMIGITTLGGGDVLAPLAILFGGWLWLRRDRRMALHYLGAVLLGWACYGALKWGFARPRPNEIARLDGAGWWSFPSGHAMASVIILGLAVVLATERRRWWAAVALLVALIAFSRVYLGVHYPSDVVAGMLGGLAWVALALLALPFTSGSEGPRPPSPSGSDRTSTSASRDSPPGASAPRSE